MYITSFLNFKKSATLNGSLPGGVLPTLNLSICFWISESSAPTPAQKQLNQLVDWLKFKYKSWKWNVRKLNINNGYAFTFHATPVGGYRKPSLFHNKLTWATKARVGMQTLNDVMEWRYNLQPTEKNLVLGLRSKIYVMWRHIWYY